MRRNIVVRFLGNDLASHKNWMKKHLISLMGLNKLNKDIKLMEAKLYKVLKSLTQNTFDSKYCQN